MQTRSIANCSQNLRNSMAQLKKQFTSVTNTLEQQYRTNLSAQKCKYYQLVEALNGLYSEVKACHHSVVGVAGGSGDQGEEEIQGEIKMRFYEIDPLLLVDFCKGFCHSVVDYFRDFKQRENQIKEQMNKMYSIQANSHFLQALARKNLQNYDLSLKLDELQKQLQFKTLECKLAQKTTLEYQKKFQQSQKDFNHVVVSIANILKESQISETELRQENRFQKELLQAQKIEFQRYKSDFKLKPSYEEKANRIRQVLQKKYQDRQTTIIKQTQKILEQKLKQIR